MKSLNLQRIKPSISRNNDRGFTLIELLMVIVIMGTLTAISIPSLLGQVSKARETDAKNILGTIARSQQAYHFEKSSFANNINNLNIAGLSISKYYDFPNPSVADANIAKHQALPKNSAKDQIRNYAMGIYQSSGSYDIAICQGINVSQPVDVGNIVNDNCTNSGIKIK